MVPTDGTCTANWKKRDFGRARFRGSPQASHRLYLWLYIGCRT